MSHLNRKRVFPTTNTIAMECAPLLFSMLCCRHLCIFGPPLGETNRGRPACTGRTAIRPVLHAETDVLALLRSGVGRVGIRGGGEGRISLQHEFRRQYVSRFRSCFGVYTRLRVCVPFVGAGTFRVKLSPNLCEPSQACRGEANGKVHVGMFGCTMDARIRACFYGIHASMDVLMDYFINVS